MVSPQQHCSDRGQRSKNSDTRIKSNDQKSNPYAEQLLLASLIQHSEFYFDFGQLLTENDFTVSDYSRIFFIVNSLYESGYDKPLSLVEFEAKSNELGFNDLCNNEMVEQLFLTTDIDIDNVKEHFYQVKKESIRRKYHDKLLYMMDYIDNVQDPVSTIVSTMEEGIIDVADQLKYGEEGVKNLAAKSADIIYSLSQQPGKLGLDIGFPVWQSYVGELRNGSVTLVLGNTKVGKSQFGMRAAVYVAHKYNIPVLVADSEMDETSQTIRAFGMYSKIPYWILETGYWKLTDEELLKHGFTDNSSDMFMVQQARLKMEDSELMERFQKIPLHYLSVNGKSVGDALPYIRQWLVRHTNIDKALKTPQALLVYDYIKLSTIDEVRQGLQEYQILGLSAGKLHDFAQKYHLPCLTFGQTNRDVDYSINCIAGSKRLAELTDSISLIKRKDPEDLAVDSTGSHMIRVFDARHGSSTGMNYISFDFDGSIGAMNEIGFVEWTAPDDRDYSTND